MELDLFLTILLPDHHQKERLSQNVQVMVPGIQILLRLICAQYQIKVFPQLKFSPIPYVSHLPLYNIIKVTVTMLVSPPWAVVGNIIKNPLVSNDMHVPLNIKIMNLMHSHACMHCHTFTVLPIAVSVSTVFLFSVVLNLAIALFVIHRRKRCKSLTTVSKLSILILYFLILNYVYEHNRFKI